MRRILCCLSLAGLFLAAQTMVHAKAQQQGQTGQQSQAATKSVSGKVTSIGDKGRSFVVEVGNGSDKQTLQFVVDKNTQVEGHVTAGTMVLVEYQPGDGGQNLCVKVSAQQG